MLQKTNIQAKYDGKYTKLPKGMLKEVSGNCIKIWCFLESTQYRSGLSAPNIANDLEIDPKTVRTAISDLNSIDRLEGNEPVLPMDNYIEVPKFAYRVLDGAELSVLAHIISKKSDVYWNFRDKRIANEIKPSYATVQGALKRLECKGILSRNNVINSRRKAYKLHNYKWPDNFKESIFDKALRQHELNRSPRNLFEVFLTTHNRHFSVKDCLKPISDEAILKHTDYFNRLCDAIGVEINSYHQSAIIKRFFSNDSCHRNSDAGFPIFVKWLVHQTDTTYRGFSPAEEGIDFLIDEMSDYEGAINVLTKLIKGQ